MEFEPVYTLHGGPPCEIEFPEGAGESFAAGQAVVIGDDGYLREAADGEAIITGIAAAPASNKATDGLVDCPVFVGSQTVFKAVGLAVLAQAHVGAYADLSVVAGVHKVANGTNEDNIFRILKIIGTVAEAGYVHVVIVHGLETIHTEDDPPAAA